MNIQDTFNELVKFNETNPFIDVVVVGMVIAGGYFSKAYLTAYKASDAIKTLIVGTVFTCLYLLLMFAAKHPINIVKCFISYAAATSFYELIIKEITKFVGTFNKDETSNSTN